MTHPPSLDQAALTAFVEGRHERLQQMLGPVPVPGGTHFAVWAPSASRVSVVGDFNHWNAEAHPLTRLDHGVWAASVPGAQEGQRYKFQLHDGAGQPLPQKADPCGFAHEGSPGHASILVADRYPWQDTGWADPAASGGPMRIYEVHAGSWRCHPDGRPWSWPELAEHLVPYVADLGFTHIELLPITEYPFGGSWGYQPTGLFAPTHRHGWPDDLRHFIDCCHQAGLGVLLDWVPAHFPKDAHGLARFDGTPLYEYANPRRGEHPDWGSLVYDYGRPEVRSFLVSSALYWLDSFHFDGLRVDAVASMLYLDYSRKDGQWDPNVHGGNEHLEAIDLLRQLNHAVRGRGKLCIAEESTAWPDVSRPADQGGLGFTHKWNMGWMHDTLAYLREDPVHRRYHHDKVTFGLVYAFSEHFVLPLSHDEVVHGKGSLLNKMPGDPWQQRANLRLMYSLMYGHPGAKLLFMGSELAQPAEWNHDAELAWGLLGDADHAGIHRFLRTLNHLHADQPALHAHDHQPAGFEWLDASDRDQSIYAWLRRDGDAAVLCVYNCTPVVRHGYRMGVPTPGTWQVLLNSDDLAFGGSGAGSAEPVTATAEPWHGREHSITLDLPPLGALFLRITPHVR